MKIGFLRYVLRALVIVASVTTGPASAGGELFDGCLDARGRALPATIDGALNQVALAALEDGKLTLRHNPAHLPELSARARMFFFAHECARVALGHPLAERTIERARQADCWALATLERSGELAPGRLHELEAELVVSDAVWESLPGPRRNVDLAACSVTGGLRLPSSAPPSEAQARVDRCVQACGDRLWQCQNRCGGADCRGKCLEVYGSCETGCGGR